MSSILFNKIFLILLWSETKKKTINIFKLTIKFNIFGFIFNNKKQMPYLGALLFLKNNSLYQSKSELKKYGYNIVWILLVILYGLNKIFVYCNLLWNNSQFKNKQKNLTISIVLSNGKKW